MALFEEQHLPNLSNNKNPSLLAWRRYVDDTFTIFGAAADITKIQKLLNTYHPCIKFTAESEKNSTIPFLHVLVKQRNSVSENNNNNYIDVKMGQPNSNRFYKRSSVISIVNRTLRICPKYDFLLNKLLQIHLMPSFNGYPSNFVQQIINKQLAKSYPSQQVANQVRKPSDENKNYKYIQIPYIGTATDAYAKILKSIIKRNDPTPDLGVIGQTTNQTRRYFSTKDPLHAHKKSAVIYQISCFKCKNTYCISIKQYVKHIDVYVNPKTIDDNTTKSLSVASKRSN